MERRKSLGVVLAMGVAWTPLVACQELPGTREQQGAVIGGVVGGLSGAALNRTNPLLGALVGSAIGAGGGYLIGARTDWFDQPDRARAEAQRSVSVAQDRPATVEDVQHASTADLNSDGFVTADELVAMEEAGLNDDEMIDRLRATNQVFDVSSEQERALRRAGISDRVIREMREMRRDDRDEILGQRR